jgi:hypothetical protein
VLGSARPTSPRPLLWVLASLVTVAHFRPREGGLLEEWGLALAWKRAGLAGFLDHLPLVAGRPLHLVPAYLGLWISDGGVTGMYLVLTATALAQFCVAGWALRPVVGQPILRALVVAAIALHPLWPAGYLLRYLPAQVSVLLFLVWFGFAVRYVGGGGAARPVAGSAALLVGLLTYQALALVYVLAGVLLVVWALPAGRGGVRRGAVVVGVTLCAVVADLGYDVVVVPRISLTAYEPSLGGHALDLPGAARQAYATTLGQMHLLSVAGLLVAAASLSVLVAAFRRRGFAPGPGTAPVATSVPLAGAGLLGALALPLAALTYASFPAHLRDLEHVGLPASVRRRTVFRSCPDVPLSACCPSRPTGTARSAC